MAYLKQVCWLSKSNNNNNSNSNSNRNSNSNSNRDSDNDRNSNRNSDSNRINNRNSNSIRVPPDPHLGPKISNHKPDGQSPLCTPPLLLLFFLNRPRRCGLPVITVLDQTPWFARDNSTWIILLIRLSFFLACAVSSNSHWKLIRILSGGLFLSSYYL